jgi:hypothetical protein
MAAYHRHLTLLSQGGICQGFENDFWANSGWIADG